MQNGHAANGVSEAVSGLTISCIDRSISGDKVFSPFGGSPGASHRGAGRSHRTEPFLIGVAGGTASGKTTVCDRIIQRLNGEAA
jgi:pantothenate kinase